MSLAAGRGARRRNAHGIVQRPSLACAGVSTLRTGRAPVLRLSTLERAMCRDTREVVDLFHAVRAPIVRGEPRNGLTVMHPSAPECRAAHGDVSCAPQNDL